MDSTILTWLRTRPTAVTEAVLYGLVAVVPWLLLQPALDFEFASDDRIMIVENQYMRDPGNWWLMLSTDAFHRSIEGFDYDVKSLVGHWRGINKLSYLIDYTLWGPNSTAFHAVSILLHVATGWVLLYTLLRLGLSPPLAGGATLLFLLHPVTARAVALVSLRADLWCGLFSMLSVAFAVHQWTATSPVRWPRVASWACAFLALLGKETAMFLPLLFTWVALCRVRSPRRVAVEVWPYWTAVAAYAVIRFGVLGIATGQQNDFSHMGGWSLFLSLSRLAFSYLSEIVTPTLVDHVWLPRILDGWPDPTVLLSWAGLAGVTFGLWRVWRAGHLGGALGTGLAILPVAPLLNIWAISGEDVGELLPFEMHRLYISILGVVLLWCLGWAAATRQLRGVVRGVAVSLLLLAPLGAVSRFPRELSAYRDTETMVRHKLARLDGFADAQLPTSLRILRLNVRAVELKRDGDLQGAQATLEEIFRLRPHDTVALKNMAAVALLREDPDLAIRCLETVLSPLPQVDPSGETRLVIGDPQLRHTGQVQKLLGRAYQMKGDPEKAARHYRLSLRIDPTDLEVLMLLAWNAESRGDQDLMHGYLERFIQQASPRDPRRAFALRKLAAPKAD